jgi:hypothetical protein
MRRELLGSGTTGRGELLIRLQEMAMKKVDHGTMGWARAGLICGIRPRGTKPACPRNASASIAPRVGENASPNLTGPRSKAPAEPTIIDGGAERDESSVNPNGLTNPLSLKSRDVHNKTSRNGWKK